MLILCIMCVNKDARAFLIIIMCVYIKKKKKIIHTYVRVLTYYKLSRFI